MIRDKIKLAFPYITEMELDKMIQHINEGGFDVNDMIKAVNGFEFANDLP